MTPSAVDQDAAWLKLVTQLCVEAIRRGGTAWVEDDLLRLSPPPSGGEQIEVLRYDDGTALINAGMLSRYADQYCGDEDTVISIDAVVLAIMDGEASESVEVHRHGTWLGAITIVNLPDGGVMRHHVRPPANQSRPPDSEILIYGRTISAWSSKP